MQVLIEGKPFLTPGKLPLEVPTASMAEAIVGEWSEDVHLPHDEKIYTALAVTAVDRMPNCRNDVIEQLIRVCENDQILSWEAEPADLMEMQKEEWLPLIKYINQTLKLALSQRTDFSILPLSQEEEIRLRKWCENLTNFSLSAFSYMVELTHSFIIPFSLVSGKLKDLEMAWNVAELHENYQIMRWGKDEAQSERSNKMREEFVRSVNFYQLCS